LEYPTPQSSFLGILWGYCVPHPCLGTLRDTTDSSQKTFLTLGLGPLWKDWVLSAPKSDVCTKQVIPSKKQLEQSPSADSVLPQQYPLPTTPVFKPRVIKDHHLLLIPFTSHAASIVRMTSPRNHVGTVSAHKTVHQEGKAFILYSWSLRHTRLSTAHGHPGKCRIKGT
jgi:hypothetical protein